MTFLKNLFSSRRWFALTVLATICLSVLLVLFAPQQAPVVHYKLTLVLLAGLVLYLLDYVLFPFASPDSYLADDWRKLETSASELREGIREELYDMKPIEEVDTQKALDMLLVMIQQIEQIRGIDAKIEILNRKLDS